MLTAMHHSISDGWSIRVLSNDLAEAYDAAAAGGTPQLPALQVAYSDYAAWQRSTLTGNNLEASTDGLHMLEALQLVSTACLASYPVISLMHMHLVLHKC